MFKKARVKLTLWYLVIIMLISLSFSFVIFSVSTHEVDRFSRAQRLRIERRLNGETIFLPEERFRNFPPPAINLDRELLEETGRRLGLVLLIINGGIFILAGGLAYFLAGRTLKPIREMVDEQNRFVTDASHEFRTPLTAIKTSLEVGLRDKNLTIKEARTLIRESIDEVNKLQSLSDRLLQLAQYQTQSPPFAFEQVSISAIVDPALRQIEPLARLKKITIINKTDDLKITGHPESLSDLLVILLDNAVKYSSAEKTVEISAKKTEKTVQIKVIDQGMGIEDKDMPKLFNRFYRADTTRTKTDRSGYGLGLAIAKRIVENHFGKITVESQPGKGSIFTVSLPGQKPGQP
mgnify:FL=1